MAREALQADTVKIEQKEPIDNIDNYEGDVVIADQSMIDKDYAEELKFMEEPVTIRLEPSSEKNAPKVHPVWVNGKGAEVLFGDKWYPIIYLPIGETIIVKRKYLEVIIRAKLDRIETQHDDATVEQPRNRINRHTSPVVSYSIIKDSQLGIEWARELTRRNM